VAAKVRVPAQAKKGEIIEIRSLAIHVMETGFRLDNVGRKIPRHIVETFTCEYAGKEIFAATLHPAIPYFVFFAVATVTGELLFTWKDDRGGVITERAHLEVLPI
jgi:sulfur-oxidizing protein SoxZ